MTTSERKMRVEILKSISLLFVPDFLFVFAGECIKAISSRLRLVVQLERSSGAAQERKYKYFSAAHWKSSVHNFPTQLAILEASRGGKSGKTMKSVFSLIVKMLLSLSGAQLTLVIMKVKMMQVSK